MTIGGKRGCIRAMVSFCGIFVFFIFLFNSFRIDNFTQKEAANEETTPVTILIWYHFADGYRNLPMDISSEELGCSTKCLFTKRREMAISSQAIVFKGANGLQTN